MTHQLFKIMILSANFCLSGAVDLKNHQQEYSTTQNLEKYSMLEKFDDIWGLLGDPIKVEARLTELLSAAQSFHDNSIYPQILSQIALAQGMQKKFNEAHATLDKAEAALTQGSIVPKVRIFLDRGKVYQQNEQYNEALQHFEQSFNLSVSNGLDLYAIDAAHMIAIISKDTAEKIHWNELAIHLANKTDNQKAHSWLGSLYNNLGQNYLEAERFEDALSAFSQTLHYRTEEGLVSNVRVANWAIGCALRKLGRINEALAIQHSLFDEYESLRESDNLGIPIEVFYSLFGFVCEELAELYDANGDTPKSVYFANLAFSNLSKSNDPLFIKSITKRLDRLKQICDKLSIH